MSKFGYLRQDDDDHWYLVPEDFCNNFDNMINQIYNSDDDWDRKEYLISLFVEAFNKYRLSGGYRDLKILMNA